MKLFLEIGQWKEELMLKTRPQFIEKPKTIRTWNELQDRRPSVVASIYLTTVCFDLGWNCVTPYSRPQFLLQSKEQTFNFIMNASLIPRSIACAKSFVVRSDLAFTGGSFSDFNCFGDHRPKYEAVMRSTAENAR